VARAEPMRTVHGGSRWRRIVTDERTPAELGLRIERAVQIGHLPARSDTRRTLSALLCKQGVVGSSPIVSTTKCLVTALRRAAGLWTTARGPRKVRENSA
jgi:hypothetical protein